MEVPDTSDNQWSPAPGESSALIRSGISLGSLSFVSSVVVVCDFGPRLPRIVIIDKNDKSLYNTYIIPPVSQVYLPISDLIG